MTAEADPPPCQATVRSDHVLVNCGMGAIGGIVITALVMNPGGLPQVLIAFFDLVKHFTTLSDNQLRTVALLGLVVLTVIFGPSWVSSWVGGNGRDGGNGGGGGNTGNIGNGGGGGNGGNNGGAAGPIALPSVDAAVGRGSCRCPGLGPNDCLMDHTAKSGR